jgi:hypothetical protein
VTGSAALGDGAGWASADGGPNTKMAMPKATTAVTAIAAV